MTEADGRRVRRRVYGKTRKEVEDKLVELRAEGGAGVPLTPRDLTLGAYLRGVADADRGAAGAANTLAAYRFHAERYLVPDLGERKLGQAHGPGGAAVLRVAAATRGEGVRTIRYVHATLRAALEDAMREELIEKNVAKLVRPPAAAAIGARTR